MKKKVKKMPKFAEGTGWNNPNLYSSAGDFVMQQIGNLEESNRNGVTGTGLVKGIGGGALAGAGIGTMIAPGIGTIIGAAGGALLGGITSGIGHGARVDKDTNSIDYNDIYEDESGIAGWFSDSGDEKRAANRVQNANLSKIQSDYMKYKYYSNPNINNRGTINAAEGGIMRRPVDALVSKGELIYDPTTQKLRQVPGSKGKPNRADDVFARLYEGDVVISNSPTMLMANGKTPALNLMGMVDKYATGGTVKAREAIIKKVVNWQEANKTKPQEYAKFDGGGIAGINKYGYNKNMSDFAYWDKDKNDYKKEYLDWVNNLTEQDVRDIESGKYGDMSEYFSKNKGKKLDVATAQKLMTDKKYGNWHKIGQTVVDSKISNSNDSEYSIKPVSVNLNKLTGVKASDASDPLANLENDLMRPVVPKIEGKNYWGRALKRNLPKIGQAISDWGPVLSALFDDYDYHTESPQITPPKFVPVNADPRPLLRAADESLAMARYNQANIGPNTGAGMAYGLQAASNRAKAYADAYQWQQETNNKLIAQNAGIHNDWAKQYDTARLQAIDNTRANEAAADAQRDTRINDSMRYYRDLQLVPFLKQYLSSGAHDKSIKRLG